MKRKYIKVLCILVTVLMLSPATDFFAATQNTQTIVEADSSNGISVDKSKPFMPILKYDVNKTFNGTSDFIDVSTDMTNVQDLSQGSFVVKFKTSANKDQTLFTIADKNDLKSYFQVKLIGGNIRLETYENGINASSYLTAGKTLNDSKYHTAIISGGESGSKLYLDGELLFEYTTVTNKFISVVQTPNSMSIGKKVTSAGDSSFFEGDIDYVEIFDKQFSPEDSKRYSKNDYRDIINIIHGVENSNIVFSGDSITHGVQHTNGYKSYSELFNDRLRGENVSGNSKKESIVINTGVSSADTSWALANYNSWIGTYNAKIVFITFGMNDCKAMTLAQYKSNITNLVKQVRDGGGIPILQTSNLSKPSGGRETEILPFMTGLRELSKTLDVFLIDNREYWESAIPVENRQNNPWLNDAIHPNKEGHLEMAKLIFRELKLDTKDSYTANLTYPIVVNDNAKSVNQEVNYTDHIKVKEETPVVSYDLNRSFYGSDYIDKTYDINKVKSLTAGTIVSRFNLTTSGGPNTIFSLSDNTNASKEFAIGVNSGGKIFINGRADTATNNVTINNFTYNDGKWHTLAVSSDTKEFKIYVDGINIYTASTSLFFGSLNKPTNLSIGRNVHDAGGEWFYNGVIGYVDVYNKTLTQEQITAISPINKVNSDFTAIRALMLKDGVANSWVLLGDNSTAANGSTYGYKNYGQYFEERIRWELRLSNTLNRQRYVVNSGVNGVTSTEILANFDKLAKEFDPELVSVMIGGRETVTPEKFEENLRGILGKIKEIGAIPMLQTPVLQSKDVSEYVNIILKLSTELGVPVVDHYNKWNDLYKTQPQVKESWLNANLDPNHRGQLEIAKDMMKALGIYDPNSISGGKNLDIQYPGDTIGIVDLKTNLTTIIEESNNLISSLKEGTFNINAKNALVEDVAAAQREISKTTSTVASVNNTINFLKISKDNLQKSIVVVVSGDVNKDGVTDLNDLAIVSKYNGQDSSSPNWETIKNADANSDGKIDSNDVDIVMSGIL